jgi:hypothetical protein
VIAFVFNFISFNRLFRCHPATHRVRICTGSNRSTPFIAIVGLNHLQFIIGSYIESRVAGTAVSVLPCHGVFTVFMWGIAGPFFRGAYSHRARNGLRQTYCGARPIGDPGCGGWRDADEGRRMTDSTQAVDG